ncbi:MAG TPA: AraC family transcriptional regulator [Vicinamibacterales bacterium]
MSAESLAARSVIPSRYTVSSRDVGWHSLLVDVHTGVSSSEPYSSIATADQIVGVALSGHYSSEVFRSGRWHRGTYDPGAICIHRPTESVRYRFPIPEPPNRDFSTAMLYVPHLQMASAAEHVRRAGQRSLGPSHAASVASDPAIAHVTSALLRAMTDGVEDLYAETAVAWLAVHLVTRYWSFSAADERRSVGVISDTRLARVVEFMSANYNKRLTLEQLAGEAGVSRFHFTRIFRDKFGQSPLDFLATLRLDAARRLLITSDLPIAQVGEICGYPAPSHFSAVFLARHGMTPTTFRSNRNDG